MDLLTSETKYLTTGQIGIKYGIETRRISRLLKNCPNFLEGVKRGTAQGCRSGRYFIPEEEVEKLLFLRGKKK